MSEFKRDQQEQDWADRTEEAEDENRDQYEKTYRDGSAVNECWAQDRENV